MFIAQVFSNNMSKKSEPSITSNSRKEEYTRISFQPDLEKFGMAAIDDDTEALLKKRVYDLAGCVPDVKVYLNDERLKIRNFRQYVDLYLAAKAETALAAKIPVIYEVINDRWEIAFTLSDGQFQQVRGIFYIKRWF
jgi:DNA topoisomerase-2